MCMYVNTRTMDIKVRHITVLKVIFYTFLHFITDCSIYIIHIILLLLYYSMLQHYKYLLFFNFIQQFAMLSLQQI